MNPQFLPPPDLAPAAPEPFRVIAVTLALTGLALAGLTLVMPSPPDLARGSFARIAR